MMRFDWGWNPVGRRRWAAVALVLGHLVWISLGRGPVGRMEHLLNLLAAPSRTVSSKIEAWKEVRQGKTATLRDAQTEVQRLRDQLTSLQIAQETQAPKLAEAEEATRLLGLRKLLPLEFQSARVISNVRAASFGGMILDQGRESGLKPDQGVICPNGVVGRIWEVSQHQSSLLPLDAFNASTGVMLARSRATGVLQGQGPGRAAIRYIGNQEVVQVGEPVYTSGLDLLFPPGLLVGHVVATKSGDVELHVEVSLAAPLDRVGLVLILPPHPVLELTAPTGTPQTVKKPGAP